MDQVQLRRPRFFFTTAAMPCAYLPDRMERKIVTELEGRDSEQIHDLLSRAGFRRSHSIAYAPACHGCQACVPVRIVAEQFTPNRTLRKLARRNADLTAAIVPARATTEQYRLFARYQHSRHQGSDMALMGFYDYRAMVEDSPIDTYLVEFRLPNGELVAVSLNDRMGDGHSAVYSFYNAELAERSLGTQTVLWLIERARSEGLSYVYLGYWIKHSRKMAYKTKFTPLEAYGPDGWVPMDLHPES